MKYLYFFLGYTTCLITLLLASCTVSPLEAGGSEIGSNKYNPLYVHVVND